MYFEFKIQLCNSVSLCVRVCMCLTGCSMLWLQLAVQGLARSCKHWAQKAVSHVTKASQWENDGTGSDMHIRWQQEREACMCVCFPLRWIHPWLPSKADLFGSPQQTSADIRGRLPTKPSLFKSAYFHLISHQYEMGSYERAQFTVHWVAVFKKNTLIDALPGVPLMLGE